MLGPSTDADPFWDSFFQFVEEGRVVPIVGWELLRFPHEGSEVSLQALLAERLARFLKVPIQTGVPGADPLNAVVCRYLVAGGDLEDVYPAVKTVMPKPGELQLPEPLLKLASIPTFRLFISTTFDGLLQEALSHVRFGGRAGVATLAFSPASAQDLPCELEQLDQPTVFHLFGRVSAAPNYVLTEEDMLEFVHALQSDGRGPRRVLEALRRNHLLLAGTGFPDWLARFFIRIGKRDRLWMARGKTDILADERAGVESDLQSFLKHFSSRTKVFLGGGARQFVDELHDRWHASHRAEEASTPSAVITPSSRLDMTDGAIFLSYASEDRALVEGIRSVLEEAGLDAWFDQGDLEPGDRFESKIKLNIEHCSLFVPIISRHCLTEQRRFFRIEWDHALKVAVMVPPHRTFIVPLVIDDTEPTQPALPEGLRKLHWLRLHRGMLSSEQVGSLRSGFRDYQKSLAAGR